MRILVPESLMMVDDNTLVRFLGIDALLNGRKRRSRPSSTPTFMVRVELGGNEVEHEACIVTSLVPQLNGNLPSGELNTPVAIAAIEIEHDLYWYMVVMLDMKNESVDLLSIIIESNSDPDEIALGTLMTAAELAGVY